MSELVTPSPEPAYISKMALSGSPFAVGGDEIRFYKGAYFEQKLNLLLHLLRSSDKAGIIVAESGAGKTALLQQIRQQLTEGVKYCYIDADSNLSQDMLLRECLRAFGIDDAELGVQGNLTQLLQQRLLQLRKINLTPVLLLDNFDQLPETVQTQLLSWLQWQQDGNFLLQAVLTACQMPAQTPHIERLLQVDLPRLSQAEVGAYLTYRLAAVDFYDPLPFSDKVMKRIYQQSKGNPAKLNQLAHQHLLGFNTGSRPPLVTQVKSFITEGVRWIGVVILIVIVTLLLIYQDDINQWIGANKKTDSHKVEIPPLAKPEKMPTVVVGENKVVDADKAERDELRKLVSEIPAEPPVTKKAEPDQSASPDNQTTQPTKVIPESSAVVASEPTPTSALPEKSMPQHPKHTVVDAIPSQQVNTKSESKDSKKLKDAKDTKTQKSSKSQTKSVTSQNTTHAADWILKQAPDNYTFQLMGSWDKAEVTDFIEKYALTGDVAAFASMRKGKVWYALIYGIYDSKQAALDASKHWPAPMNTLPTWLRRLDSVQQQIKDKAPTQ